MNDFRFQDIAPRLGSQRDAFEELCGQLARRTLPDDARFVRLSGSGGDGGVLCSVAVDPLAERREPCQCLYEVSMMSLSPKTLRYSGSLNDSRTRHIR